MVRQGKKDLTIRETALSLVQGLPPKDWRGEVSRLHSFVRDNIRYVKDIAGVETLHTPSKLLEIRQGDCDDQATLLAALLESIGHPTRFVAVRLGNRNSFSHVLIETKIGNKWVAAETTEPWPLGKAPRGVTKRLTVTN